MPHAHVQCPSCGAMLGADAGVGTFFCSSCGARLRRTVGASGKAMAVFDDATTHATIAGRVARVPVAHDERIALKALLLGIGVWFFGQIPIYIVMPTWRYAWPGPAGCMSCALGVTVGVAYYWHKRRMREMTMLAPGPQPSRQQEDRQQVGAAYYAYAIARAVLILIGAALLAAAVMGALDLVF